MSKKFVDFAGRLFYRASDKTIHITSPADELNGFRVTLSPGSESHQLALAVLQGHGLAPVEQAAEVATWEDYYRAMDSDDPRIPLGVNMRGQQVSWRPSGAPLLIFGPGAGESQIAYQKLTGRCLFGNSQVSYEQLSTGTKWDNGSTVYHIDASAWESNRLIHGQRLIGEGQIDGEAWRNVTKLQKDLAHSNASFIMLTKTQAAWDSEFANKCDVLYFPGGDIQATKRKIPFELNRSTTPLDQCLYAPAGQKTLELLRLY